MAPRKKVPDLFNTALTAFQSVIERYAITLSNRKVGSAQELLANLDSLQLFFTHKIPKKILEQILNTYSGQNLSDSKQLCYYYLILLRCDVETLVVSTENSDFTVHEANALFYSNLLNNLKHLECGHNCTDHILYLISIKCPNIETLNAMSRCKPFTWGATTDVGLKYLAENCKKLKVLHINDPQLTGQLSHDGVRNLLRSIPTLEIVFYNELGDVICNKMEDVEKLSLKIARQYNVTSANIKEILRLCPDLEHLHLDNMQNLSKESDAVLRTLIEKQPKLRHLSLRLLSSNDYLSRLCSTFLDLRVLELIEMAQPINCNHLISIGSLRKLKQLNVQVYKSNFLDNFKQTKFHSKLTSLTLRYADSFCPKAFHFCTDSSKGTLEYLFVGVQDETEKVADYLIKNCDFVELNSMVLAPSIVVTTKHIFDLMAKFNLTKLAGRCFEDTSPVETFVKDNNLDFEFKVMNLMYYNGINHR